MEPLQRFRPPLDRVPPIPCVKECLHGGGPIVGDESDVGEIREIAQKAGCVHVSDHLMRCKT
jgi:hypothetical protein